MRSVQPCSCGSFSLPGGPWVFAYQRFPGDALIRKSLHELQSKLDPAIFWPIQRSTVVNANAIAGVQRDFRGQLSVTLKNRAERLAVSESNQYRFKQM
jgi:DNA-binding LytR/AlgR family response regulator